jgi:sugar phosphate isomerase/epimerase
VLSGQRHPGVSREQGLAWVIEAIEEVVPVAVENQVVLGMENHYKDGRWQYPEFAQRMDVFLEVVNAFRGRPNFGVQYDPSNALVAGDDPLELLRGVADRVVSVHASDRYLPAGGSAADLRHGATGRGLNDYDTIFSILAGHGYRGWVSIEDGMNGMEEMRDSIAFLRQMSEKYFPEDEV